MNVGGNAASVNAVAMEVSQSYLPQDIVPKRYHPSLVGGDTDIPYYPSADTVSPEQPVTYIQRSVT